MGVYVAYLGVEGEVRLLKTSGREVAQSSDTKIHVASGIEPSLCRDEVPGKNEWCLAYVNENHQVAVRNSRNSEPHIIENSECYTKPCIVNIGPDQYLVCWVQRRLQAGVPSAVLDLTRGVPDLHAHHSVDLHAHRAQLHARKPEIHNDPNIVQEMYNDTNVVQATLIGPGTNDVLKAFPLSFFYPFGTTKMFDGTGVSCDAFSEAGHVYFTACRHDNSIMFAEASISDWNCKWSEVELAQGQSGPSLKTDFTPSITSYAFETAPGVKFIRPFCVIAWKGMEGSQNSLNAMKIEPDWTTVGPGLRGRGLPAVYASCLALETTRHPPEVVVGGGRLENPYIYICWIGEDPDQSFNVAKIDLFNNPMDSIQEIVTPKIETGSKKTISFHMRGRGGMSVAYVKGGGLNPNVPLPVMWEV
ncbi:hypothetical protein [Terasakiella sp. SH-1]|uniref:hypothetical protein n=1 Tax=Terasakiella sp. SH-1 TaxID=2560057 RepID=UPI0010736A95|nr:hypothetical protein [Terasakiella sp. SH-1]